MDTFGKRLKQRAAQLGISEREAAKRCELEPRRFAHYTRGDREPDLETLVKIAIRLETNPNWLLGVEEAKWPKKYAELMPRLVQAGLGIGVSRLKAFVIQAEALAQDDDY